MEIPLIYVLVGAELLLLLLGISITLAVLLMRRPAVAVAVEADKAETPAEEPTVNIGSSYIEYLQQAMKRNEVKIKQQQNIGAEEADERHHAEDAG